MRGDDFNDKLQNNQGPISVDTCKHGCPGGYCRKCRLTKERRLDDT